MAKFKATLERVDTNLERINIDTDSNGGDVVDKSEFDCQTPEEAMFEASDWAERLIFVVLGKEGIPHARYPWRFLSISAFGNDYGLGHATRHYREGGQYSCLGGYALFLSWNPERDTSGRPTTFDGDYRCESN